MNDKMVILLKSIEQDVKAIQRLYDELGEPVLNPDSDYRDLIVVAYHMHHLYNAFENIFLNIAVAFENSIEETERWHTQLLERMTLDLSPLRP